MHWTVRTRTWTDWWNRVLLDDGRDICGEFRLKCRCCQATLQRWRIEFHGRTRRGIAPVAFTSATHRHLASPSNRLFTPGGTIFRPISALVAFAANKTSHRKLSNCPNNNQRKKKKKLFWTNILADRQNRIAPRGIVGRKERRERNRKDWKSVQRFPLREFINIPAGSIPRKMSESGAALQSNIIELVKCECAHESQ